MAPPRLLLGPMLRFVDDTTATIWVETDRACSVSVLHATTPTFTIEGRHYALVVVDSLTPGSITPYRVQLDGHPVWPEVGSPLPPSVIRTPAPGHPVSVLFGSCRAAAPHEAPYTLELAFDHEGRGVDTLWAHGCRMLDEPPDRWPDLLVLLGDQIYADDSSPQTKQRVARRRPSSADLPPEIVADYEEYCWLYHEAWSLPVERWLLSTVPTAMIFDDHDNIDDWNISAEWVADTRAEPWWRDHAIGGLMSYWVYQHLGNQSPELIAAEGLLRRVVEADDGTDILRRWAAEVDAMSAREPTYRFSHARRIGAVDLVVIDCRNGRILDGDRRLLVNDDEWSWVQERVEEADQHLVIAASLPVYIADGLHDLQVWNEAVCDGAWGGVGRRIGERVRRALDLEDWAAFGESYRRFHEMVRRLAERTPPLRSITIISGDIHFSYAARVPVGRSATTAVWQIVSSPIRNALIPPERGVLRATLTPLGRRAGALLRRSVGAADTRPAMRVEAGPFFANNMCELRLDPDGVTLTIEQSSVDDEQRPILSEVARLDLRGIEE